MKIIIDVGECRNEDCGDWWQDEDGTVRIRTSSLPVESQIAVAIHELIEFVKCKQAGITDERVTQFDAQFSAEQTAGKHSIEAEAGNDKRAPYFQQHQDATFIERCVIAIFNMPWEQHEKNIQSA